MKILHTADWHLGQRFYEYDRTAEHQQFLDWLRQSIYEQEVDVLIIAGDVFDVANPSAEAQAMFYRFLAGVTEQNPHLQIIVTAGNHDSASRLEAPAEMMKILRVHVSGSIRKTEENEIDYQSLIIPVTRADGVIAGYCLAVPYLRSGDYPVSKEDNSYTQGVRMFYNELFDKAWKMTGGNLPIVAVGHLHTSQAELSDSERSIRGGLEVVSPDSFDDRIAYTALGHIHKAQKVGGKENVRYSGSPLPMSFSEIYYKHRVILADIAETTEIQELFIPRPVGLLRIGTPEKPLEREIVFRMIDELPEKTEVQGEHPPYLEINIALSAPEPLIRNEILERISGKHVLFARSEVHYPDRERVEHEAPLTIEEIERITPLQMFEKAYGKKYGTDVPEELTALFHEVCDSLHI